MEGVCGGQRGRGVLPSEWGPLNRCESTLEGRVNARLLGSGAAQPANQGGAD